MCDLCLPRRTVLVGAGAALGAAALRLPPAGAVQRPAIVPRSEWGPELVPTGPIPAEPDVRIDAWTGGRLDRALREVRGS